ncbi:lipocalin [Sagittula salina]|uniref:Lipocalin n=1 Tax=Sagittula salina TaxID=2820268 RepID=A0A940S3B5_9RHOB|nr:lipocalin [Sagittula salina]MBP0482869.1 lipocalin [Sagittula salina]
MRWLLPLVLAGCTSTAVLPRAPVPLRNPTAPVASQTDVSLSRLGGRWQVVESSRAEAGTEVLFGANAMRFGTDTRVLVPQGLGRFDWGEGTLWVHWLDADNRTLAMGDPGGGWFAILDRTGRPGERLRAAREILEWYGYDLSRLAVTERGA